MTNHHLKQIVFIAVLALAVAVGSLYLRVHRSRLLFDGPISGISETRAAVEVRRVHELRTKFGHPLRTLADLGGLLSGGENRRKNSGRSNPLRSPTTA